MAINRGGKLKPFLLCAGGLECSEQGLEMYLRSAFEDAKTTDSLVMECIESMSLTSVFYTFVLLQSRDA